MKTIEYIKNPEVIDATGTKLKATVKYLDSAETDEIFEFTDNAEADVLFHKIFLGEYGTIKPFIQPYDYAGAVRKERNQRLKDSDWTQLDDISPETKNKWKEYRTLLRDITKLPTFPHDVIFPTVPE